MCATSNHFKNEMVKFKTNMLKVFFLILAITQISLASICLPDCTDAQCTQDICPEGTRPVFVGCDCCKTCEKVLKKGETCTIRAEPLIQPEIDTGDRVSISYPRCGFSLRCDSQTRTCV
nr:uncharacterized protein LOC107453881 [Parasteatoda tepidariorum]